MQSSLAKVLIVATSTVENLLRKLERGRSSVNLQSRCRLAVLDPTAERLAKAKDIVSKGRECRGLGGIWYVPHSLLREGGKLAFGFPGIDSTARVNASELAKFFGWPLREINDQSLESRGTEVFYTSDLYAKILAQMGIKPSAMFGHSLGEWSGVIASGLTPAGTADDVLTQLQPGMLPVPGVIFAALGCGADRAQATIDNLPEIYVSHDNCPHQSIICGIESSVNTALSRLSGERIMCQKLDFKSGFHTELFRPFLGPLKQSFDRMTLSVPSVPLWSATTCKPFPPYDGEIRELLVRHLLEKVRFRELTEALYADGVRVFIQVGAGSLPGFIDDTLRGRPHVCLSTTAPKKSALEQFQRFCLGLFAEGADFDLDFLLRESLPSTVAVPISQPTAQANSLLNDLQVTFENIRKASSEIVAALSLPKAFKRKIIKHLSLVNRPELEDHSFYKQKLGWKNIHDRFPVMPMTGSVDLVVQMARELFPEQKVVAVEEVAATKWLAVDVPRDFEFLVEFDGHDRVKFNLPGHFVATVVVKKDYAVPPQTKHVALPDGHPAAVKAENLYTDGWLFHGPRFQGIKKLGAIGAGGLGGTLRATSVPGALLDNAGQLAGYLIMEALDIDRYAMPIKIERIEFFSDQPTEGEVECTVRFDRVRARDIMLNFELSYRGKIWARVAGWQKWRFETDDRLWKFLLKPGTALLSDQQDGCFYFERPGITPTSCDDLSRRYLRESERAIYETLGQKKVAWICGRVAAKDAVRKLLWANGYEGTIFPAEILIENDEFGRPLVLEAPGPRKIYISISHTVGLGLACAGFKADLGIDVERIEPREISFEQIAFTAEEIAQLPTDARSEWITRLWGAKEAYSKAKGRGLQGDPKSFRMTEFATEKIKIEDRWIKSFRRGDYIVSRTEDL